MTEAVTTGRPKRTRAHPHPTKPTWPAGGRRGAQGRILCLSCPPPLAQMRPEPHYQQPAASPLPVGVANPLPADRCFPSAGLFALRFHSCLSLSLPLPRPPPLRRPPKQRSREGVLDFRTPSRSRALTLSRSRARLLAVVLELGGKAGAFRPGHSKEAAFLLLPLSHIPHLVAPLPFPLCPASSRLRQQQQRAEMTRRCRLCARTLLSHSFSCATSKLVLLAHRLSNAWTAVVCRVWLVSVTCAGDEAALYHIQRNYVCLDIHFTSKVEAALGKLCLERRLLVFRHCAITHQTPSCA